MRKTINYCKIIMLIFAFSCSSDKNNINKDHSDRGSKIDSLIQKMSVEEKVGQMTQLNVKMIIKNNRNDDSLILDKKALVKLIEKYHIGSFLNGSAIAPEHWYEFINKLQKINLKHSNHNIPLIYGIDHVHGANYIREGTIYPHNINLGATFNTKLAKQEGKVTALECADVGHLWNFAPILGIGVNPVWPRFYETYGEDPYLASAMGSAYIKGIQDSTVSKPYQIAACAKHFLGYSDPESGWDRTPAEISDQRLHEFFLPPFKKAIESGVKTIMINSGDVNGVPVHASRKILTDLLRKKLNFKGVALTDWKDIKFLHTRHKVAKTEREATKMAINAGVDMSMVPNSVSFCKHLIALVKSGEIPEARLNKSVRRILKLKLDIGLFDHPFPRNDRFDRIGQKEHRQKALQAARESLVLLKNHENLLPLGKENKNILITGPNAHRKNALCGGWSPTWQSNSDSRFPKDMHTLYTAIKKEFPNSNVELIKDTITKKAVASVFRQKARKADLIVFAGGERPYSEGVGNINDLRLDKPQREMVKMIHKTGKPLVMILLEGRPRIITELMNDTEAVLWAGLPGLEGATAIAEVLRGKVNPSGKLSFTYPKYTNHIVPYHRKITDANPVHKSEADISHTIAPFGYGLSYTNFEYSNLQLSDTVVTKGNTLKATVTVKNTGKRKGKESVLWFIRDKYRKITPSVKLLKDFEKKEINPGKSKTFSFTIKPSKDLFYANNKGEKVLEEGVFKVITGSLEKSFRLKKNNEN